MRVAVFGASGFVGSTLVERLWADSAIEVRPIIHSTGNAARLARSGRPLIQADLMLPATIDAALAGCSHVVNCSRGPAETMTRGLQNLLAAAKRAGVGRFVHVSSVAAYGDAGSGEVTEHATPAPAPNTYGDTKLKQDELVARAAGDGLRVVILCPPNISGPYSAYLLELIDTMRRGQFALVDDGRLPCELVDVGNLAHALQLALTADVPDTERIFVTDGPPVAWAEVAQAVAPLADWSDPIPRLALAEAQAIVDRAEPPQPTLRRALRHLASGEVRQALKREPWFGQAERTLKTAIRRLPALDQRLRKQFAGGPERGGAVHGPRLSARLLKQQLRGVAYSQQRAHSLLEYAPVVTFTESMQQFNEWYRVQYGWRDEWWPLVQHLRAQG